MKSKTQSNASRTKKICSIRFGQNIKLSQHTSASSAAHQCAAAHSLGNTALGYNLENLYGKSRPVANPTWYLHFLQLFDYTYLTDISCCDWY